MIQSVEKALNILSFMVNEGHETPVSLGDIAEACRLNPSTCAHLVETLCACAYLEKLSRKDGYMLGPMGYCVSSKQYYRQELIQAALPVMRSLCESVKEDVSISTFSSNRLFVPYTLLYHEGGCSRRKFQTGRLYCSSSGRLVMAYMSPHKLDGLLESLGMPKPEEWNVSDRAALEAELALLRSRGVAVYRRVSNSISAVAAPVLLEGKLQGVVGVYMEDERFEGAHLEDAIEQTVRGAKAIARRLQERLRACEGTVYRAGESMM
ncbi:MAG TPA: IclR family transcriptional regulator C-terminal domain-containing protein [Clostridia bacterium]|nr:IclR family transcriptional regulator C-terminal domain-containing protein [Clostridia bacterium]